MESVVYSPKTFSVHVAVVPLKLSPGLMITTDSFAALAVMLKANTMEMTDNIAMNLRIKIPSFPCFTI